MQQHPAESQIRSSLSAVLYKITGRSVGAFRPPYRISQRGQAVVSDIYDLVVEVKAYNKE